MLVITRKMGEAVTIGEGEQKTTITVLSVDRGKIKLGFEADRKAVPIMRNELAKSVPPCSDLVCKLRR